MDDTNFPHHSGGVVQVRHLERFGAVPEALLEDDRLDLDSRAVAAWLAVKPAGWQISITNLRKRLARKDKAMLGKDRWQRIAHELESAGYLSRKKINGPGGHWIWNIIFNPVPSSKTICGSAGHGLSAHDVSGGGSAGVGVPGHKEIPRSELPIIKTTTTTKAAEFSSFPEDAKGRHFGKSNCVQELYFPLVSRKELDELEKLILFCRPDLRQDVLDEIEGIRRVGAITRGVVPLAKVLIKKSTTGEFSLSAGLPEQRQREIRQQHEKAIAHTTVLANFLPISEESISNLPPNVANKVREAIARRDSPDAKSIDSFNF